MKVLGIMKSSGIELVDATVENGSVFPAACPGNLGIACTSCKYARQIEDASFPHEERTVPSMALIVCHWYADHPAADGSASS